ncbi:MAG: peptidylprolyl isomerase [Bacteroidales bacterium]
MNVSKDKVVSVSYELKVEGDVVDKAESGSPMQFIFGNGTLLQSFENNIKEKSTGDEFDFTISSDNAYGEVNKDYILKLPMSVFEKDGKVADDLLKVGARLPMVDQEGNQLYGLILDVKEDHVLMDFNHPLAGKDLSFTGKVEDVREATEKELSEGHVHKEGSDCCGQ